MIGIGSAKPGDRARPRTSILQASSRSSRSSNAPSRRPQSSTLSVRLRFELTSITCNHGDRAYGPVRACIPEAATHFSQLESTKRKEQEKGKGRPPMVQGRRIGLQDTEDGDRRPLYRYVMPGDKARRRREYTRGINPTSSRELWSCDEQQVCMARKQLVDPCKSESVLTNLKIDKKCPFTGLVSIRGRILTGTVVSTKMHRTLVIRREYLHFVPKYARYEKRHKNLAAHVSPAFRVEEGDQVTVGQCRPLSKTVRDVLCAVARNLSGPNFIYWANSDVAKQVRFNVLRVLPRTGKAVKAFQKF